MICILTEDKPWVPDAVTLLESQGHEVTVTNCSKPLTSQGWYAVYDPFSDECKELPSRVNMHYPDPNDIGLISIAFDPEYSGEDMLLISDQVIAMASE